MRRISEDYENLFVAWKEAQNRSQANAIRYQLSSLYELTVIEALADRQFLPHYGCPIGVQKLRIITPDERYHGRIREEDQYRLERASLLALREYVPGSQLLVGGKLIASRGLLKHWTGATIDRSLGLRGKFTYCTNDHFHYWYDIGLYSTKCSICEAPPRENVQELLIPKYGFTTAAWDPPRWSTDVERVGTTETATITFSDRAGGGTTFDMADFGGIDRLSVRYREDGELLVYNGGESGRGFAICLKCGYSQSESKYGQGAMELPTGFARHAPAGTAQLRPLSPAALRVVRPIATGGEAPGQFLHHLGIDQLHFVLNFVICGYRNRVFQHHKWQLRIIQSLLLCPGHREKCLGDDAHCGNTNFLEIDRILETPGGTAASFSDPGNDGVSPGHEGLEHLVARRAGEERFLRMENSLDALALLQQMPQQIEIAIVRLELIVV